MRCEGNTVLATEGEHPAMSDPWHFASEHGPGTVLAVLTATHGPAYRNPGAAMAIASDGRFAGAITSGCIEADLILRADEVRRTGLVQNLRYGEGSPFIDLRLPCGGAVEVRLLMVRDLDALSDLARARTDRRAVSLAISSAGKMTLNEWRPNGSEDKTFHLGFRPDLRFLVFGTGAEAAAFAGLVRGMGYDHLVLSHEDALLAPVQSAGSPVRRITSLSALSDLRADADTAVVLFYHDHDYEPGILHLMLSTPAFYIGSQGSRATQSSRLARLEAMGVATDVLARLHGPIGLIPSTREPKALAISVMAEIIGAHEQSVFEDT
jgi:xanthine dehydrogenase accessory factor